MMYRTLRYCIYLNLKLMAGIVAAEERDYDCVLCDGWIDLGLAMITMSILLGVHYKVNYNYSKVPTYLEV